MVKAELRHEIVQEFLLPFASFSLLQNLVSSVP